MAVAVAVLAAGSAHAVDIQPMDWTPAPSGTHALSFYSFLGENDGVNLGGARLEGSLNSTVVMPRYTYYFEMGGKPALFSVVAPMGSLHNGSLAGASLDSVKSFGDMSVVAATWLVNNPDQRQYLAFAGYLHVPTGEYNPSRALNLGSDRFGATLQLGGQTALSEKFTIEGTLDATFFAANDNANASGATLTQDTSYSLQTWLSYHATPATTLSVGYAAYGGGEQYLDDVATGFNGKKQQVRLGVTHWLKPDVGLYGQINHDFGVDGGFIQDTSAVFRIAKLF
ncbi:transporter [Methylobacterium aquaticum]|uniref:transporter n=1 Tax=Methylobacterium aquaticum TaxID=270351 RepID=UPI003D170939